MSTGRSLNAGGGEALQQFFAAAAKQINPQAQRRPLIVCAHEVAGGVESEFANPAPDEPHRVRIFDSDCINGSRGWIWRALSRFISEQTPQHTVDESRRFSAS